MRKRESEKDKKTERERGGEREGGERERGEREGGERMAERQKERKIDRDR